MRAAPDVFGPELARTGSRRLSDSKIVVGILAWLSEARQLGRKAVNDCFACFEGKALIRSKDSIMAKEVFDTIAFKDV